MSPVIKKIIDETGATNVKNIRYLDWLERPGEWQIEYKDGLVSDEFETFKELLDFLYYERD